MPDITRILCPTDLSDVSRHAMTHAAALARWYRARLVGLYVHAPMFVQVPAYEMASGPPADLHGQVDLGAFRDDTVRALRGAAAGDVEVDAIVRTGSVPGEILEYARVWPADLIVMGTHGAGGFEHLLLGSVTEKVLRKARCAVLTVPPRSGAPSPLPFKRIVCPVDFSDVSSAIVEFAGSLAREGATTLTLLHVLEWDAEEALTRRHFSVPEYHRYQQENAAESMTALVEKTVGDAVHVETRFAHGKAYREILAVAAEEQADLIVMGVHGRNALDVMLFGSTTNHVVRRATCPVLTLRQ